MHISLYGDKHMQKTKIIIALAALTALTLIAVGLASAQTATNQPTTNPDNGFLGWIGNCFGYRQNQPYTGQYDAPKAPTDDTVPQAPYQGNYDNGYGYGPCWAR